MLVLLVFGGWLADRLDPRRLLVGLQTGAALMPMLLAGEFAAARLPAGAHSGTGAPRESMWREIGGGLALLFSDSTIRATFLLICSMGVFFAGVMVVLIPLAVRDLYAGGAQEIALGLIAFGVGTLVSFATMIRLGGVRRPGRALCLSQFAGCAALTPIALASPPWVFYLSVFVWGLCGGVAMTMSRTLMQENAPAAYRGLDRFANELAMADPSSAGTR